MEKQMKQKIAEYWLNRHRAMQANLTQMVEGSMQEFSDQQNAYLIEAIDYALQTIVLQSQGKPIGDLDERIAHFERILKDNGK